MKTTPVHQNLEIQTEIDVQEHVYQKPVRYVDEMKWRLIKMVSNQQSFIDRATYQ